MCFINMVLTLWPKLLTNGLICLWIFLQKYGCIAVFLMFSWRCMAHNPECTSPRLSKCFIAICSCPIVINHTLLFQSRIVLLLLLLLFCLRNLLLYFVLCHIIKITYGININCISPFLIIGRHVSVRPFLLSGRRMMECVDRWIDIYIYIYIYIYIEREREREREREKERGGERDNEILQLRVNPFCFIIAHFSLYIKVVRTAGHPLSVSYN